MKDLKDAQVGMENDYQDATKANSKSKSSRLCKNIIKVGLMRFELMITAMSRQYPNQLDYRPTENDI